MLRSSSCVSQAGYRLMSNAPVVIKNVRDRFLEIATEARTLAAGLQSVAPSDLSMLSSNTTVQYLFEVSDQLEAYSKECDLLLK